MNKDFLKQDKNFFEYGKFDFTSEKVFLDKANFHQITKHNLDEEDQDKNNLGGRLCFIDGGSCELIKSSDLGLFFIRIVGLIFKDNKKIKTIKNEFYALIFLSENNGKTHYQFEKYDSNGKLVKGEFKIDIFDKTMMFGGKKVNISCIGDLIRSLSEIELATKLTNELEKQDIIVMDGNLEIDKTYKYEYFKKLYESAESKKINVCAISKTCNIITNKARSIIPAILDLNPDSETFYYYPTNTSEQNFDIAFVKLNKNSDYVFRLDFLKSSHLDSIISGLAYNSTDFVFPGYPYGLIMADKFARISNQEKQYNLTSLKTKAGNNWNIIKKHINTLNAHDVLDNIG